MKGEFRPRKDGKPSWTLRAHAISSPMCVSQVGDPARGYLLELLLTKLRYAAGLGSSPSQRSASKGKGKSSKKGRRDGVLSPLQSPTRGPGSSGKMEGEGLQIVGMSATMANTKDVAKWLNVSGPPAAASAGASQGLCRAGDSASCLPFVVAGKDKGRGSQSRHRSYCSRGFLSLVFLCRALFLRCTPDCRLSCMRQISAPCLWRSTSKLAP